MRQERRGGQAAGGTLLPLYEWIIDLYAPYVLVRCVEFTNDRSQALMIGAYTLTTACLMTEQLDHVGQIGISIDVTADVVGPDVVRNMRRRGSGRQLIADPWMQGLAKALNRLERPMREALVLRYISGLTTEDMVSVLSQPAAEVATRIAVGERQLASHVRGIRAGVEGTEWTQVRAAMTHFAAKLDADWVQEVRDCAIGYFVRCNREAGLQIGHWHLN